MNFEVITPKTTEELLAAIASSQNNNFRFGAGCTDLLMELKSEPEDNLIVVNLSQLKDEKFSGIEKSDKHIRIGALVTVGQLLADKELHTRFPVLEEAAANLASMQIRQVATVGGNLCTASPSGDISCALVALEASCEILNTEGGLRTVPITEFFTDVRKTVIKKDEVLRSVLITTPPMEEGPQGPKGLSGFIKIGTRRSMECSVVSLAYHILTDNNGIVQKAGIAIGSVAPTVKFVTLATDFLVGRSLKGMSGEEKEEFATLVTECSSPISDIRASAWYRNEVLNNISRGVLE
ncbi:MAG: FAD binding domain-containing protein [Flavobacteriales bacterium]